jgi:hypothetical protein
MQMMPLVNIKNVGRKSYGRVYADQIVVYRVTVDDNY